MKAQENRQWLLVSLHDEGCFDCHILNRDVWKDSKIYPMIKQHFTFIQVSGFLLVGLSLMKFELFVALINYFILVIMH